MTQKEYVALKRACSRAHRSVSEFARLELLLAIRAEGEEHAPAGSVQNLGKELFRMQAKLEELKEILLCKANEHAISAGDDAS